MRMLSLILRSVHFVYLQHVGKELMRTLSIRVRNWCVRWAYASGIMRAGKSRQNMLNIYTHQELMHTLSIRVRTDAFSEYTRQGLMCTLSICISFLLVCFLSISIKAPNLKRSLQNMPGMGIRNWNVHWACASGTMSALSVRVRNWCARSACAP